MCAFFSFAFEAAHPRYFDHDGIRAALFYDCDIARDDASGVSVMCDRDTANAVCKQVSEFGYSQFRNEFATSNIRLNCNLALSGSPIGHFWRMRHALETSNVSPHPIPHRYAPLRIA